MSSGAVRARGRRGAIVIALVLAAVTAVAVSWATTPDGNLVVTLVPAVIAGSAMFALARWRLRRKDSA